MSASRTYKTYTTRKFIEPAIFLRWFAFGLMSVALVASWFLGKQQISKVVSVAPDSEDYVEVGQLKLQSSTIGATRIRADAIVPTNHWVTYELLLIDSNGELVSSAMKEAWSESGTWREGGESGTWSESNTVGGLDVKSQQAETLTLAVSVLDYTTSTGLEVTNPVNISVRATTGVVFRAPLFVGWIVTALLTWMSGGIVKSGCGKRAIFKTIPDSDVGARGTLGGSGKLVHLHVTIESDEDTPVSFQPELWIRNADGEDIYTHTYDIKAGYKISDTARTTLDAYFRFLEKGSYGFYLEVLPDMSVDRTTMVVFDNAKTTGKVTVTDIENVAIADIEGITTNDDEAFDS